MTRWEYNARSVLNGCSREDWEELDALGADGWVAFTATSVVTAQGDLRDQWFFRRPIVEGGEK